jgi:diguanylate cyclase (GGDEF)-like protein
MLGLVMFLVVRLRKRVIQLQTKLEELSTTDSLTTLHNRRFLMETLDREIARSLRSASPLSLLMVDLDYFKKINDTYGHGAGDRVLTQVAQAIKGFCRVSDIVARYGGEEISVLAPQTDLAQAMVVAEKLRVMIESLPLEIEPGKIVSVTLSIGVVQFFPQEQTPAQNVTHFLSAADTALYRAKAKGRNRVEGPSGSMAAGI